MRAIDRSEVICEAYSGAANDFEAEVERLGGWVCEQHPDLEWPHGDCAGPGMPRDEVLEDEAGGCAP